MHVAGKGLREHDVGCPHGENYECEREEPSRSARNVLRVSALHLIDGVAPLEIVDEPCEQTALPFWGVRTYHLPGIEVSEGGMECPVRFEAPDAQFDLQGFF